MFNISRLLVLVSLLTGTFAVTKGQAPPRVLVVIAHPDDESTFAVTLYKITKEHHGTADLFVISDGEGGYKYSTLAENYYGVELTNEAVGRANLPHIRKKELMNAGNILGINDYYFLDQKDAHYTLDEREPLDTTWNTVIIKARLKQVLTAGHYDYIFCLLPEADTHGQHKAATILALQSLAQLPEQQRPVVLGARIRNKTDQPFTFKAYKQYAETRTLADSALVRIDRTATLSFKNRVNYKVISNWEIAEHKSQGVMQMAMNDGDYEEFWYFSLNGNTRVAACRQLFKTLQIVPYPVKTY